MPLYLPDDETFASFWPGDNPSLLAALQNVLRQEHSGYIYFWSREGAGRSHLLHAACAELSARGDAVGYVPLDKRTWFVPDVLEGMEQLSLQALQLRARQRGFELPEDVGRFLLKRLDREMRTLFMTLDQLDRASITAQRKLTIPFVKDILSL